MSDLNQLIRVVKEGAKLNDKILESIATSIERYEFAITTSLNCPICCYYCGKSADILENEDFVNDKYIRLNSFKNYSTSSNEEIIGCTRGCLPIKELSIKNYNKELCKDCVEEAKKILKNSN